MGNSSAISRYLIISKKMSGGHNLKSGYAMPASTGGVKRNFSISIYIEVTGEMAEYGLRHMTGNHARIKPPRVQISFSPPIYMSHGSSSYLKIRKGLQGKHLGHGCWFNGFVRPSTKFDKRRASKRVRHAADVPNGKAFRKEWGYWEWC